MTTPDSYYVGLGVAIKTSRSRAHVTQQQLATAVGLQRTSISNIEKGRQKFLMDTFYQIAYALRISPVALLEDSLREMDARQIKSKANVSFFGLSEEEQQIIAKSIKINEEGGAGDAGSTADQE
jgi:DNA-binding XRE family transcriptional regulator